MGEHEGRLEAVMDDQIAMKEDPQVELARESVKSCEDHGSPPEASVMVSNGAAQPDQTPLVSPKQMQTTSQSKALSAMHLDGNSKEQHVLDAILKNKEALKMVLRNQDLLRSLVGKLQKTMDKLQKTVSIIDERLHAMEQETGLLAQFTQELNEVGNESSCG